MIFIVDSDEKSLKQLKEALEAVRFEVATFDSAESALDLIETLPEPELIVSGFEMKGMDGFEFLRAYRWAYPYSTAPFVFYTSQSDEASMIMGLEKGADDYLIKPLSPKLLSARLVSAINRRSRYLIHTFYADAAKLPFFRLMQFCESKGLTGEVEIVAEGQKPVILSFRAGQMQADEAGDDVLMKLYDLSTGVYIIRAMPMDFEEMMEFAATDYEPEPPVEVYAEQEKPMGKLSGVQVEKRLFQLQSEFVIQPSNQIVTIVVLDGKVVNKRINAVPPGKHDKRVLERMIEQQHMEVEKEIRDKLAALAQKKAAPAMSPQEQFKLLFNQGFERYKAQDLTGALEAWEHAYTINPTDKTLETNIRILRKKLGLES